MRRRLLVHVCIGWTVMNLVCLNADHINSHGGSKTQHVCELPHGFEPNFEDSDECSSYWVCGNHGATLQYCQGSDQFHFQYGKCMNDEDVSCWVQMEKYYHGFSYRPGLKNEEIATSKICTIAEGQEPNYLDEGCKSYWYCDDHEGTLHECPDGFQFHWGKRDCVWDEEVFCEKQMEFFYEHIWYKLAHSGENGGHTQLDDFSTVTVTADLTTDTINGVTSGVPRRHHKHRHHRCDVEEGREPDYDSPRCQTFWRCVGYRGLRQKCPPGYLFHWGDGECLKDVYVDCVRQRKFASRIQP